ncbi:MAG TPA: 1,4-dihydroxy-2-naphthoate octaprenyltransferase [Desulfobacterales bacterium]
MQTDLYRNWFLASRPWSFTMSIISVSVGAGLAAKDGAFSWMLFLVTVVGMVMVHAATNLINDFYDVGSGVDYREVSTARYRPHPLLEGRLRANHVFAVAWLLYGLSAVLGLWLAASRGWSLIWIAAIGFFASLAYTAPPLKYKYKGLGEFSVFLMWGPLMVEGAYFVQRQRFSLEAFWVSIPFGVLVALVLLINNLRDAQHDRIKGIVTLPILIGQRNGLRLYTLLVALAYLSILWMSIFGPLDFWALIVLLTLPLAWRLMKQMRTEIPMDADARTAQLDTLFGIMLVLSLIPGGLT